MQMQTKQDPKNAKAQKRRERIQVRAAFIRYY
jgi:hypothetical protein